MADVNVYQNISVSEYPVIQMVDDFSQFERGYPFEEITIANVEVVEFENGAEQRRDMWGKVKKQFNITFPVMKKAEVLAIQDFWENVLGPAETFIFTNPVTGITYPKVKFVEGSFKYTRSHFDTYFASVSLVEVF